MLVDFFVASFCNSLQRRLCHSLVRSVIPLSYFLNTMRGILNPYGVLFVIRIPFSADCHPQLPILRPYGAASTTLNALNSLMVQTLLACRFSADCMRGNQYCAPTGLITGRNNPRTGLLTTLNALNSLMVQSLLRISECAHIDCLLPIANS